MVKMKIIIVNRSLNIRTFHWILGRWDCLILQSLIGINLLLQSSCGLAQTVSVDPWPTRPIRIITTDPGGAADIAARLIAPSLTKSFGQPVFIDNRSGGGSITAIETVINSAPDGHTLLLYGSPVWLMQLMKTKLPWDPIRDLAPISLVITQPNVLAVHPSLPVKTVQDLIALAKQKPGQLNYSSGSVGASNHLAAELFNSMANVKIERIPYKGGGAALMGVLTNQTQLIFGTTASVKPQLEAGKLRAIAVTSSQPSVLLPGIPTVSSTGLSGYEALTLYALFAPAKTPKSIIHIINQEVVRALLKPDVQQSLLKSGNEATPSTPEGLAKIIDEDIVRWGKTIREANITAD
jgi:tripartite-type tricarboxylate transporter receptor subunit TctC